MTSARGNSRRTGNIAIVFQRVGVRGSGVTDSFLDGVATECATYKLGQMLGFFTRPTEFRKLIDADHQSLVDGFIIGGIIHSELINDMVKLQKAGKPIVTIYPHPVHRSLANIGVDQVGVGRLATEHLIKRGCRKIAHFSGYEPRLVGYRQALRAAGIHARPEWLYCPADRSQWLTVAGGEQGVAHLDAEGVAFDGLVCLSDLQAMGAIRALVRSGRRVPEDVKVIGSDNSPLCEAGIITLSSVADDVALRGRMAVRALLDRLRGRAVKSLSLEPVLHPRESTAAV